MAAHRRRVTCRTAGWDLQFVNRPWNYLFTWSSVLGGVTLERAPLLQRVTAGWPSTRLIADPSSGTFKCLLVGL